MYTCLSKIVTYVFFWRKNHNIRSFLSQKSHYKGILVEKKKDFIKGGHGREVTYFIFPPHKIPFISKDGFPKQPVSCPTGWYLLCHMNLHPVTSRSKILNPQQQNKNYLKGILHTKTDNKEWHWTAIAILATFSIWFSGRWMGGFHLGQKPLKRGEHSRVGW